MSIFTYLPETDTKEGCGSLFQREIYAYLVSLREGGNFIRSNLSPYSLHEPCFISMHTASCIWNSLFSFNSALPYKEYIINTPPYGLTPISYKQSCDYLGNLKVETVQYLLSTFRRQFWAHNACLINDAKEKFSESISVALHLRNYSPGDTQMGVKSLPWEIFSEDYGLRNENKIFYAHFYASLCSRILRKYPKGKRPATVFIYSTGERQSFEYLLYMFSRLKINVQLHLNRPSYIDFLELITADHLVCAKSSFSHLAALCSHSPKYARKHGNRFPTWIDVMLCADDNILY
jgi:hypothetical protein